MTQLYILIAIGAAMLFTALVLIGVDAMLRWANEKTYKQRGKIIRAMSMNTSELDAFGAVSYEAHMFRLMTFRDPMKLYPDHFRSYI
jgi:hypothetical protein